VGVGVGHGFQSLEQGNASERNASDVSKTLKLLAESITC